MSPLQVLTGAVRALPLPLLLLLGALAEQGALKKGSTMRVTGSEA